MSVQHQPELEAEAGRGPASRLDNSAVNAVGELFVGLTSSDSWELVAFDRDETLGLAVSSTGTAPNAAALRADVRAQRFSGVSLPQISTAVAADGRRTLSVTFGDFRERVAIVRVGRRSNAKPFSGADALSAATFFSQHGERILKSIFETDTAPAVPARERPLAFIVDEHGTLLSSTAEAQDGDELLRAQLMPQDGQISALLLPVVMKLLERFRGGADSSDLVSLLPFALVRLAPLRSEILPFALLVSVERLRTPVSIDTMAARYSISKRELQVLRAMLRGAAVAEIAAELSISESTVVFHLKRMLRKTFAKNRVELAARMLGWEPTA